jgi:hypothetical protein
MGVSSDGKVKERDMDIWGFTVVAPVCVDWRPFVVDLSTRIWLCTDRMLDLWGLVNWRSWTIVVVGWYPTIPLEMSIGIVYGQPTDSPVCGIVWKTCTRERCDPDRPYDIVVKGCHMWPVRGRAYVMLVRFIPLQGWLLIQISATLSDMSDSLFSAPTHRNACLLLWWWLRLLINDDDYITLYLLYNYDCYLACSRIRLHLYSCIINMAKMVKIKYWK